jgi:hypothetical protein
MTNHEVIYGFRMGTKCSWPNLVKFVKRNLNCIRFYLTRARMEISMVITHEQWALTSFLSSDRLALILVSFSLIFLGLGIINYRLLIN